MCVYLFFMVLCVCVAEETCAPILKHVVMMFFVIGTYVFSGGASSLVLLFLLFCAFVFPFFVVFFLCVCVAEDYCVHIQ